VDTIQPQNLMVDLGSIVQESPVSTIHDTNDSLLQTVPESEAIDPPFRNHRPQRSRKQNQKYYGDQWFNVGRCSRSKLALEIGQTKEAIFLAKLSWDDLHQPIEEWYMNLLYRQDPYTNEGVHGEMGYYTHLLTSDSPTLEEILSMDDQTEKEM
jgi:hypothetical protein